MTNLRKQWQALTVAMLLLCLPGLAQTRPDGDTSENELRLGDSALASQDYRAALRAYMTASQLSGEACVKCFLKISTTCVAMKNWRDAVVLADRALAIATTDTDKAQAHNLKGTAYLAQAGQSEYRLSQAEQEYRAATQGDPSVPPYHFSLGVTLLKESHDPEAIQELRRFVELAPEDSKAPMAKQWIADPRRARGQFVPEFRITSAQGDEFSLDRLKGKIVVLDFWATWCAPCREALPDLKDLAKKYPSDRFVLISVNLDDDPNDWRAFVENEKMTWPQVYDGAGQLFRAFGLEGLPTYIVLSGNGSLIDRVVGTDPNQSIAYRLKAILAKQTELNPH
jgi:thiol-disulfide isomerase/thioredoxin